MRPPGRAVALVPNFFVSCEEFLPSSFGPGWLELPIFDCRLLMDIGRSCDTTFSILNRQSAIKTWPSVAAEGSAVLRMPEGLPMLRQCSVSMRKKLRRIHPVKRQLYHGNQAYRSANGVFPKVRAVDSRFRGNDCDFERPRLANDTSTGVRSVDRGRQRQQRGLLMQGRDCERVR